MGSSLTDAEVREIWNRERDRDVRDAVRARVHLRQPRARREIIRERGQRVPRDRDALERRERGEKPARYARDAVPSRVQVDASRALLRAQVRERAQVFKRARDLPRGRAPRGEDAVVVVVGRRGRAAEALGVFGHRVRSSRTRRARDVE